jgi:hypothetical protein
MVSLEISICNKHWPEHKSDLINLIKFKFKRVEYIPPVLVELPILRQIYRGLRTSWAKNRQ